MEDIKKIQANSEIVMHFLIKLTDGSVAEDSHAYGKPAKFVMGDGSLTPNFEACLLGLSEGRRKLLPLRLKMRLACRIPIRYSTWNVDYLSEKPKQKSEISLRFKDKMDRKSPV